MKITYVANSRFPSERAHMTQIVHMCNAFAALGHEVTLLVTDRTTHIKEDPAVYYGTDLAFSVARLQVPDIAGNIGRYPRPLWPLFYTWQRFIFARTAVSFFRQEPSDIVYGRDEWVLWFLSRYLPLAKIVFESHEAKLSYAARSLLRRGVRCVTISEGIRDVYHKFGVPEKQLLVAHDAIDDSFFAVSEERETARRRLSLPGDQPLVMYIGGLAKWKGVDTFLQAAAKLPSARFVVIGGAGEVLEKYKRSYPKVLFLGERPYRELPQNQQAADVLVIPNTARSDLSAKYTSPLKLFAHMASHRPIVAARVPSITSVLNEDETFFFTADDPRSLAEAVAIALHDKPEAERRTDRAFTKSQQYTWQKRAKDIVYFIGN